MWGKPITPSYMKVGYLNSPSSSMVMFLLALTSSFWAVQGLGLTHLLIDIYVKCFTSSECVWTSYLVQKMASPEFFINIISKPLVLLKNIHASKPWPLVSVCSFSLCLVTLIPEPRLILISKVHPIATDKLLFCLFLPSQLLLNFL